MNTVRSAAPTVKITLTEEDAMRLAKDVDTDSSGQVDYKEFVAAFKVSDKQKASNSASRAAFLSGATPSGAGAGAGAGAGSTRGLKRVPTAELRGHEWDSVHMEDVRCASRRRQLQCCGNGVVTLWCVRVLVCAVPS